MKPTIFIISLLILSSSPGLSIVEKTKSKKIPMKSLSHKKNNLAEEQSPYLLQHAQNPVWWQAWSKKSLAIAQTEDKPIFLSIGYATCHWCHVMEGDSFEKEDVALILNNNFISIKVDREERPDIDQLYMDAAHALGSRGGWPLTIIMTPKGKPFFAATFIPREKLKYLLLKISELWLSKDKEELLQTGKKVHDYLSQSLDQAHTPLKDPPSDKILTKYYHQLEKSFDHKYGGFGNAPKFPSSMSIMMLFRIYHRTKEKKALEMAFKTLDNMAKGGIHDHLGGGFHRYSTDEKWLVPHFEKMLYDNALLLLSYTEAYQISKNPEYKIIAERIIHYIERDLTAPKGGFYAAEDADSEKAEGKFYVWKYEELKNLLNPKELEEIKNYYGVSEKGNFDTTDFSEIEKDAGLEGVHEANILHLDPKMPLPYSANHKYLEPILNKLLKIRTKRVRPLLDHQIITGWNGLMIAALARASQVFNNVTYKNLAIQATQFILKNLYKKDRLHRSFANSTSKNYAYLEDYAFFIFALLELYQTDFNPYWYKLAQKIQDTQIQLFWHEKQQLFFDTDGTDETLIIRTKDVFDNAIPSGNSMSAYNLLRFAGISYNQSYSSMARQVISSTYQQVIQHPSAFPFMLCALDYLLDTSKEIAIVGNLENQKTKSMISLLSQSFIPNKVIAAGIYDKLKYPIPLLENKPLINSTQGGAYVCEDKVCKLPTLLHDKVLNYAKKTKYYKLE